MHCGVRRRALAGVCCLVLSAGCGAAVAADLYIGGTVGGARLDLRNETLPPVYSGYGDGFAASTTGFGLALGGYVTPMFGWELSFLRFGDVTRLPSAAASPSESLNALAGNVVFYYPLTRLNLFLKAGPAGLLGSVHAPDQNARSAQFIDLNVTQVALATGAGVQYRFHQMQTSGWAVRAQYDGVFGRDSGRMLSAGVYYDFWSR